jgi:SAM-dependent methyltransferase
VSKYMKNISNNFPNLKDLAFIEKLTFFEMIIFYIKRYILNIKIFFSKKEKNDAENSKNIYENIALEAFQLDKSKNKIISILNGKPVYSSLWNRRIEAAKDFMKKINEINAKKILEIGCGEGIVLFTALQINQNFLDGKSWKGFDFSVAAAINCKTLFENYQLTKKSDIEIYNGDATNIHYDDKAFDVTVCNSVLDQIKYEKLNALSEMMRVAKYSIIREPIISRQSISGRIHFKKNDYCLLEVEDIEKFGEIISIEDCPLGDPTYLHSLILTKNY